MPGLAAQLALASQEEAVSPGDCWSSLVSRTRQRGTNLPCLALRLLARSCLLSVGPWRLCPPCGLPVLRGLWRQDPVGVLPCQLCQEGPRGEGLHHPSLWALPDEDGRENDSEDVPLGGFYPTRTWPGQPHPTVLLGTQVEVCPSELHTGCFLQGLLCLLQ